MAPASKDAAPAEPRRSGRARNQVQKKDFVDSRVIGTSNASGGSSQKAPPTKAKAKAPRPPVAESRRKKISKAAVPRPTRAAPPVTNASTTHGVSKKKRNGRLDEGTDDAGSESVRRQTSEPAESHTPSTPSPTTDAPSPANDDPSPVTNASPEPTHSRRKRGAESETETSTAVAPVPSTKRQKVEPAATTKTRKQRAKPSSKTTSKAIDSSNPVPDRRPEPRGQPTVWADTRRDLCEALPYYRGGHQASAYNWGGYVLGFLVDNDNDTRGYMDEKVVITRTAGGYRLNKVTGKMVQMKDQSSTHHTIRALRNNQRDMVPITLMVGSQNPHCPTVVPYRYNVLGIAQVTDLWAELVNSNVVCRIRFEMIDLVTPSWWGVQGSPNPPESPDFTIKAHSQVCPSCGCRSKQMDQAGWMCHNDSCADFWKINGQLHDQEAQLNDEIIHERSKWPGNIIPPFPLKPAPPQGHLRTPNMETAEQSWRGLVCPQCGRCNSRANWDEWICENKDCDFVMSINHTVFTVGELASDHAFEAEGHTIAFDTWDESVLRREQEFIGFWRVLTYHFPNGDTVAHWVSNTILNGMPGGADEILDNVQQSKMGLRRMPMANSPTGGEILTRHFGMNYGMPYKYVASAGSKAFSEAPSGVMQSLSQVTWTAKTALKGRRFQPFNECLVAGYMEKQLMGWHDDGERDLGPDVGALSIGGASTMDFRMKGKYCFAHSKHITFKDYDPTFAVSQGEHMWEQRAAVNQHWANGENEAFEEAKAQLFVDLTKRKSPPTILSIKLKHGDIVTMHGNELQRIYEHRADPIGKLRYCLTGRYVKPENLPEGEHYKAVIPDGVAKDYDGGLAQFKERYPDES